MRLVCCSVMGALKVCDITYIALTYVPGAGLRVTGSIETIANGQPSASSMGTNQMYENKDRLVCHSSFMILRTFSEPTKDSPHVGGMMIIAPSRMRSTRACANGVCKPDTTSL